jgi:hypothetical protein
MTTISNLELTTIETASTQPFLAQLKGWLAKTRNAIFQSLLTESSHEPRIKELRGDNGESFWEIYNPRTQETFYCMTQYEVMECLEKSCWRQ